MPSPDWIELDGAVNVRWVVPGVLLRRDNLQGLTPADVAALLSKHNLARVVDLRTHGEVAGEGPGPLTRETAVEIRHHPLYPDGSELGEDTDRETGINPWLEGHGEAFSEETPYVRAYLSYLVRRPDSVLEALRAIAEADGAVVVHCAAGKDRTGVIVALALDLVGVDRAVIIADYLATADRIDAILARLRGSDTYREGLEGQVAADLAPQPGTMERVLEIIDLQWGGTVAWLTEHGLTDDDLARLRARLGA